MAARKGAFSMKNKLVRFFERFGSSVLLLLLGLALMIWPTASGTVICYSLGGALLAGGILRLWAYFRERRLSTSFLVPWNLAVGAVLLALGLFFVLEPQVVLSILPVMLGIILILTAVPKAARAVELRHYQWDRWWIPLVVAVVLGAAGLWILLRPFNAASVMIRVVGFFLAGSSLLDLWLASWVNRQERSWQGRLEP